MFALRILVTLLVLSSIAHARPLRLVLADDAACPTRQQVMDELGRLVPQLQLAAPGDDAAFVATIGDLGDRYRVHTLDDKEIADAERRCDERARVASLLIALALETPRVIPPPQIEPSPLPTTAIVPYRPPTLEWGPTKPRAQAFIDRPLVLERGRVELQATFFANVAQYQTSDDNGPLTRFNPNGAAALSVEVGVGGRTQLGLAAAIPLRAEVDAGAVIASAMVRLHRSVALRASLGWERDSPDPVSGVDSHDLFFASVALPFRHRVHRWVSLIGGDPGLRPIWFASEPAQDSVYLPTRLTTYNDALFAMRKGPGWFEASVYAPFGELIQLHRMVMLAVQFGPRLFFNQRRFEQERSSLAGSLTLAVSPTDRIDLGLSIDADLVVARDPVIPAHAVNGALFFRVRL